LNVLYVKRIREAVKGFIGSAYVIEEGAWRPVNAMFITKSGGGRSSMLLEKFGQVKGVYAAGDITYDKLVKKVIPKIHRDEIKTLIMAEFNKILGRKASTARNIIGILMEIIEEGCPSIDLPYYSRNYNPPARANLLVGMTPSFFKAHLLEWWGQGFIQRFSPTPITWGYTDRQVDMILGYIKHEFHQRQKPYFGILPDEPVEVKIPYKIADKLEKYYTREIVDSMTEYVEHYCEVRRIHFDPREEEELPFRTQIRLQRYLKGLSLMREGNDGRVTNKDYKMFKSIFPYMNLKYKFIKSKLGD